MSLRGRKVVVTGASGHLGANLLPRLLAAGAQVRVLVHQKSLPAPPGAAPVDVEAVPGDVLDPASLARAFEGAELVFHLAARISIVGDQGGRVTAVNVEGARNVARAARAAGARRLVHVSSVHAFDHGDPASPLTETAPRPTPRHPAYDRSKAAGEAAVREAAGDALEVVVGNPTGIIGPDDHAPSRMGRVLIDLQRRRLPALTPGGFDWVDARDVSDALIALADRGRPGEGYLLGGRWASMRALADAAAAITGVPAPRFSAPAWVASATAPLVSALFQALGREPLYTPEALHAVFKGSRDVRTDKARAELGYTPRPLEDTLRDTYAFFERAGRLSTRPGPRKGREPTRG